MGQLCAHIFPFSDFAICLMVAGVGVLWSCRCMMVAVIFLSPNKSLCLLGFLISHGSLISHGFLGSTDSLISSGFLGPVGSLLLPGFLFLAGSLW